MAETPDADTPVPGGIDTTTPHSARFWNYLVGGKDNFQVDRDMAAAILTVMPQLGEGARADREFLRRVVTYLTKDAGIVQFIDIGTGLPSANNTHEVAQSIIPDARIVYVDNDPLIMVHAKALLVGTAEGTVDYLEADIRDLDTILTAARRTLDFSRPIAVMLMGVLNFVTDDAEAEAIVRRLLDEVPSGSYLAISHPTPEVDADAIIAGVDQWNASGAAQMTIRTRKQLLEFFATTDLLEPGVVSDSLWRPEPSVKTPRPVYHFGGLARKP